jgi:hypothetical protein
MVLAAAVCLVSQGSVCAVPAQGQVPIQGDYSALRRSVPWNTQNPALWLPVRRRLCCALVLLQLLPRLHADGRGSSVWLHSWRCSSSWLACLQVHHIKPAAEPQTKTKATKAHAQAGSQRQLLQPLLW